VEEVDPVLHPGESVRDLPEVTASQLLLALEVERAVIGRDDLEVVLDEAGPQVVPMLLRAERRRTDELGAIEPVAQVVQ